MNIGVGILQLKDMTGGVNYKKNNTMKENTPEYTIWTLFTGVGTV